MKKRVMITILMGAFVVGALFTGCSKSDKISDSTTATENSTVVTTQSTTEKATQTTATEKATAKTTEQTTSQNTTETTDTGFSVVTEKPTVPKEITTDIPTQAPTQAFVENETSRTDGSILTNTEYRDTLWGMTMTFPESWQNNNIVVLNNNGPDGRTLSFVEKSNYNSDKNLGLIFKLRVTTEPIDESNNEKNLGYFVDENGNTLYLSLFNTSDVRANLSDETLTENYRQVFRQKDDALSNITFDEERDFHSTVNG